MIDVSQQELQNYLRMYAGGVAIFEQLRNNLKGLDQNLDYYRGEKMKAEVKQQAYQAHLADVTEQATLAKQRWEQAYAQWQTAQQQYNAQDQVYQNARDQYDLAWQLYQNAQQMATNAQQVLTGAYRETFRLQFQFTQALKEAYQSMEVKNWEVAKAIWSIAKTLVAWLPGPVSDYPVELQAAAEEIKQELIELGEEIEGSHNLEVPKTASLAEAYTLIEQQLTSLKKNEPGISPEILETQLNALQTLQN